LDDAVNLVRTRLRDSLGLPFPGVLLLTLPANSAPDAAVVFEVHGVPVLAFQVPPQHLLLAFPAGQPPAHVADGFVGPALFGIATQWVPQAAVPDGIDASALHGPESALALTMLRIIETRPHKFVGVQEALILSHQLEQELPELDREMRQAVPLPRLAEVCRLLLEEGISLRDLSGLAQALVDYAAREKDTTQLVEKVRCALSDQITHQHTNAKGELAAVIFSPELEEQLAAAVRVNTRGSHLPLPQSVKEALLRQVERAFAGKSVSGLTAVLLVHTPELRPALRSLLRESGLSQRAVLSVDELRPNLNVLVVGEVDQDVLQQQ
jgi:type III secretion protein V